MDKTVQPQWLEWAKELQFIAQGGIDILQRCI